MKYSWFHHHKCSTEPADQPVVNNRRLSVKVERSLNRDNITWTVSAQLLESEKAPRPRRV